MNGKEIAAHWKPRPRREDKSALKDRLRRGILSKLNPDIDQLVRVLTSRKPLKGTHTNLSALSERVGIPFSTLQDVLDGEIPVPSRPLIRTVSGALAIPMEELANMYEEDARETERANLLESQGIDPALAT